MLLSSATSALMNFYSSLVESPLEGDEEEEELTDIQGDLIDQSELSRNPR